MSEHTAESEKTNIPMERLDGPEGLKKMADFLRGRKGMSVRHGVEMGKRVEYFKGDKFVSFLLEQSVKSKYCPFVKDKDDALRIGRELIREGYIHRSERDAKNKKMLQPVRDREFVGNAYYTWMYDGPKTLRNVLTTALIVGFFICTCFPIWPMWAKVGLWYISVTLLIIIVVFSMLRLMAFFACWLGGYDFWFLPNIYDDNLGVIESFKPLYSFKATNDSERKYRAIGMTLFVMFCYWVANQPTEFDEYVALTKQFTDDLYSGKMLDDISQHRKENIDKIRVPDLAELMQDEAEDDHDAKDGKDAKDKQTSSSSNMDGDEQDDESLSKNDDEFDQFMEDKYFSDDQEGEDPEVKDEL